MSFRSTQENWEGLAQKDALWAICTHHDKKAGKWDLHAFFETGEKEISAVWRILEEQDIQSIDQEHALDFGCGVGRLSLAISKHFEKVTGVDVSQTMIQKANTIHADEPKLHFVHNTASDLAFIQGATLSFVYSSIVLQHISYPESLVFIKEFIRILKPGGIAIFQVPTKDIRQLSLIQRIKSSIRIRERLALLGIGTGYHMEMNCIPESEILSVIKENKAACLFHTFTNHTDPNFSGELVHMQRSDCIDFESSLFVVRKL